MGDYPATELASAMMHGSGNSTGRFYKIEVRTSYHSPTVIGQGKDAFVIDHCWREYPIVLGATQWGVNIPVRSWDAEAVRHGLLSFAAAEAHRWAFLAYLEASQVTGTLCIETRLVAVEFQVTYSTKELGVGPPLTVRECAQTKSFAARVASTHTERA